jgi:hypothetical protein
MRTYKVARFWRVPARLPRMLLEGSSRPCATTCGCSGRSPPSAWPVSTPRGTPACNQVWAASACASRPSVPPSPLEPSLSASSPPQSCRRLNVGLDHLHGGGAFPSDSAPARLGARLGQVPQDCLQLCLDCLGPFLELLAGVLKDVQHHLIGHEVHLHQLLIGRGAPHPI